MIWVCRISVESMDAISSIINTSIYDMETVYNTNDIIFYITDPSSNVNPRFYICRESQELYNIIDANDLTIDLYQHIWSFIKSVGNTNLLWDVLRGRGYVKRRELSLLILSQDDTTLQHILSICSPLIFYNPKDVGDLVFNKIKEKGEWLVAWIMQNSGELGYSSISSEYANENLSSICHLVYAGTLPLEDDIKIYEFLGWCFRYRRDILSIIYRHKFRKEILLILRSKCSFAETHNLRLLCGCPVCQIASIPPYIAHVSAHKYKEIENYIPSST